MRDCERAVGLDVVEGERRCRAELVHAKELAGPACEHLDDLAREFDSLQGIDRNRAPVGDPPGGQRLGGEPWLIEFCDRLGPGHEAAGLPGRLRAVLKHPALWWVEVEPLCRLKPLLVVGHILVGVEASGIEHAKVHLQREPLAVDRHDGNASAEIADVHVPLTRTKEVVAHEAAELTRRPQAIARNRLLVTDVRDMEEERAMLSDVRYKRVGVDWHPARMNLAAAH